MEESQPENHHLTALIRNSGFNLIGQAIPLIIGLIAIPLTIKGLGVERFGLLSLIWTALAYMSLADFGLGRTTTKFVAEALGKKEKHKIPEIIWTSLLVQFGLSLAGGALLFVLTPFVIYKVFHVSPALIYEAKMSLYFTAFSIPPVIIGGGLIGVMEGFQRYDVINAVRVVSRTLMFLIPALSYPFHLNLGEVFFLLFLHAVAFGIINILFCFRIFPPLREKRVIDLHIVGMLLLYGGWLSVAHIVWTSTLSIDRFIIGAVISTTAVSYYAAPYEMIARLSIIPTSFVALFPFFSSLGEQRRKDALDVFLRISKHLMLLMGPIVIIILVFSGRILEAWLGMNFRLESTDVLQILTIGVFVGSLSCLPDMLLKSNRPDWVAKFLLILFLFFIGPMYFLTKKYGIDGTASAWTLRALIGTALMFWLSGKLVPLKWSDVKERGLGRSLLWVTALGLTVFGVKLIWKETMTTLVLTGILTILFAVITWRFIFDETDRQSFLGAVPQFLKKKRLITKNPNSLNIN